ncbi:MAG: NAD(P)H-binding protein [Proteobacteria bacterium]|nr:NAD(P)H-binding protein [Pseudomonadota bacterium]
MKEKKILVLGGTGKIGSTLITNLSKATHCSIKIFSRHKPQDMSNNILWIEGDMLDYDELVNVMCGVDYVFLNSPPAPNLCALQVNAINAAVECKVKHIVRISAMGSSLVDRNSLSCSSIATWHAIIDKYLIDSGVNYTILKPNYFMQNLVTFKDDIIKSNAFQTCLEKPGKISMIHADDIAEAACACLLSPEKHVNKSYDLTGLKSCDFNDIANFSSKLLSKDITHVSIPKEDFISKKREQGYPDWFVNDVGMFFSSYSKSMGESMNRNVELITGRKSKSLESYLKELLEGAN